MDNELDEFCCEVSVSIEQRSLEFDTLRCYYSLVLDPVMDMSAFCSLFYSRLVSC